jgi:hypothetical protein
MATSLRATRLSISLIGLPLGHPPVRLCPGLTPASSFLSGSSPYCGM